MAYTAHPAFWATLFRQLLNTCIHSAGDDPLLAQAHRIFQKEPAPTDNALLLAPIALLVVLDFLIRYMIGHVFMTILILDTVASSSGDTMSDLEGERSTPSSRRLLRTGAALYRRGGFGVLLSGMRSAITYWTLQTSATKLLTTIVGLSRPVSHIAAACLLAENRYFWTAKTILPREQRQSALLHARDLRRWKTLVPVTTVHAVAESLMMHMPALLDRNSNLVEPVISGADISDLVRSDILIAGLMLAVHILILIPSSIMLVLVQASLLSPACETLVLRPAAPQRRGRRVGEILSAANTRPLHIFDATRTIRVRHVLWYLEMHAKMCLCLFGVSATVHAVIFWMS